MNKVRLTFTAFHLLLFSILTSLVYGQEAKHTFIGYKATPENFEKVMQMSNPNLEQFDTLWKLTQLYGRKSKDTSLMLSNHAADITQNSENKSLKGKGLLLKAKALIGDSIGLPLLLKAREILQDAGDFTYQSMAEASLGDCYKFRDDLKTALDYNLLALETAQKTKDTSEYLGPLMGIGAVYYNMGNFEKAVEYIDKTIGFLEAIGNTEQLPPILNNQAKVFKHLGEKHRTIADTIQIGEEMHNDSATLYFNLGLKGVQRALELSIEMDNQIGMLASRNSIADLKNSLGAYQDAIEIGNKALSDAKKMGMTFFILECRTTLAQAYLYSGQLQKAQRHAELGYELTQKKRTSNTKSSYEKILYTIYNKQGRYSDALRMLENIREYERKLHLSENKKAITEAEIQYKTSEKEKEILQQRNNILELEAAAEKIAKQRNWIMVGGLLTGLLAFLGFRFNKIRKERNDKKEFAEALIFAQENERKRIAQDLHDGIGQSLLLIKKQMSETTEITLENQQMIANTLDEVRSISRDLHPFQLDKFGLKATIDDMIIKIEQATGLFITREIENIDQQLASNAEIHLFRTIQEAFNNIVKHASATAAKISISNLPKSIEVSILDNGTGFDFELAVVTSRSLGLRTMHERISAIGGQLKIGKSPNGGTQVDIIIPKSNV